MTTKTITYTVFKFSELSDKAKDRALSDYLSAFGYDNEKDAMDSLKAGIEAFGCSLKDWEISWDQTSHSSIKLNCPEMERVEIAKILDSLGSYNLDTLKGNGDCKLTGYCMDESFLDGVRIAFHHGERDLEKLMQEGFSSWLKDCQSDFQYQCENFNETCEANEWVFLENGKLI